MCTNYELVRSLSNDKGDYKRSALPSLSCKQDNDLLLGSRVRKLCVRTAGKVSSHRPWAVSTYSHCPQFSRVGPRPSAGVKHLVNMEKTDNH